MTSAPRLLLGCALLTLNCDATAIDPFFVGTHFHDAGKIALSIDGSVKSLRLWDARLGWNYLQPTPAVWRFQELDKVVDEASANGMEILLPLGLTPPWASSEPTRKSAYGPGNASPPARLADWENYVRTVALRYKGRIKAYEIWNEPNRELFYAGTMESLFRLTCSASRIIREIDPTARIVSSAPTDQKKGVEWLEQFLETPVARCIDAVGFHLYTLAHEPPEAIIPLFASVQQVLQGRNLAHLPVWNTEFGWYIDNARTPNTIQYRKLGPDLARDFLVRSFIIQAALGIGRSYHYAWNNTRMGAVEPDTGERKTTAAAYPIVSAWLDGATAIKCQYGALVQCDLLTSSGHHQVLWSTGTNTSARVPNALIGLSYQTAAGSTGTVLAFQTVDGTPVRVDMNSR